VPKHQLSQQTPSAQNPELHCAAELHAAPLASFVMLVVHAPEPLHEPPLAHSPSGFVPEAMLPQTPLLPLPFFAVEQAWQAPMQMLPQQNPSTQ
jgi:hypothetical protein